MSVEGKNLKRSSPGADETKKVPDPDVSDGEYEKLRKCSRDILRIELANDRANNKRLAPAYARRRAILKEISKFWPLAFLQHRNFGVFLSIPDDQKALLYLEDVWVERHPEESRVFNIELHFGENPYFTDKVIKKEYLFVKPEVKDEKPDENGITDSMVDFDWERDVAPQAIKINWKSDEVNLTKKHPMVVNEGIVEELGSFFNFFEHAEDDADIGLTLANEVFMEAIDSFEGKLLDDMSDFGDESDEEDEDEDDASEIDLEKPEPPKKKKQRHT